MITEEDDIVIIDNKSEDSGKNYNISFDEEYLSSQDDSDKEVDNDKYKQVKGSDFVTHRNLSEEWGKVSSGRIELEHLPQKTQPSYKTFDCKGIPSNEVYNQLFDKMIKDNIQ